ncbi:MAG TPA: dihydroorotase [Candidatus Competibacteraceae bacterium]|nr:dihydroorotase [Candidatus Competibacteraceae bacterium]
MNERILIRGGRLVDPAQGRDGRHDLYLVDGRVAAVDSPPPGFQPQRVIEATGKIVCPGLVDLAARLREPGAEHKATIASETRAAAAAGITTLVCPPDTDPVVDETAVARLIQRRADAAGYARVLPLGALTQGLAGEQLAEMAALKDAGCVGVSNGHRPLSNTLVLRRAMEYAATFGLTVFLTPLDTWLAAPGCAHDGQVAARLGLAGIPAAAETAMVARDLALIEDIGVRAHFCRLSSARAVELVAEAQEHGLPVTADVCAHQLHLSEIDLGRFDSQAHVIPPLRTLRDRDGLRRGLATGVLGALCSDHQPHEVDAKLGPFAETEPGISALETLLPLGLKLVAEDVLPLPALIERLTVGPARILGLAAGTLAPGARADVCIFDPEAQWIVDSASLLSRGHNTPFLGWELKGRVSHTLLAGRLVYDNGTFIQ